MKSNGRKTVNRRKPPAGGTFWGDSDAASKYDINSFDFSLLVFIIMLTCIGIVMIFSSSGAFSYTLLADTTYFLKQQLKWLFIALTLMCAASVFDYRYYRKLVPVILGAAIVLLILAPIMGERIGGARRWLSVGGFLIHVGEPSKIAIIVFMAVFLDHYKKKINDIRILVWPMIVLAIMSVLLMMEPDFGMTAMVGVIVFVMLFVAGIKKRYLLGIGLAGVAAAVPLVMCAGYRARRIIGFLHADSDPMGAGFQKIQSMIAIANGGVFGQGLGNSLQKRFYLPQQSSDFIFSIIGEELGLIGMTAVALLFVLVCYRGLRIANRCNDPLGAYLAVGIVWMISFQAIVNMAVATGLVPVTGTTLPFISFGGASLVCSFIGVGILLNISSHGSRVSGGSHAKSTLGSSGDGRPYISGDSPRKTLATDAIPHSSADSGKKRRAGTGNRGTIRTRV